MKEKKLAQREYYGKALADLAVDRLDVYVLDADLAGSTKTLGFKNVAPERFIECGIAEQNMIGIASGLAASGKTVFASTFAVFATGRCWEQIRLAVAYPKMNVKIVATHSGISVGEDGASHQALEDVAIMRALPNMVVISPADAYETFMAIKAIADYSGPVYMRLGRSEFPTVTAEGEKFEIGVAKVLREGTDATVIAAGQMVYNSMVAAEILENEGINIEVINMATIKPLDTDTIRASVSKTGCVVTAEEHSIIGGLGSAVADFLSEEMPVPMTRVGTRDTFGESGKPDRLFKKYGLTAEDIAQAVRFTIEKTKSMTKKRGGNPMKIFIDTANLDMINEINSWGILDGVTTNPSLIAKEGTDTPSRVKEIAKIIDGPISAEAMSLDAEGMIKEGRELAEIHPNINVKLPMCIEALKATKVLSSEGINVNVTLIFSAQQALLAAKAGARYVSPFVGRLDDIGLHGCDLVGEIIQMFENYDVKTEVIAASIRGPAHVLEVASMGCDIATVPYNVLKQMVSHPKTDEGIQKFIADYSKKN